MEDGACLGVQRGQVSLAEVLWESLWKTFFSVANRSVVPTGVGRDSLWVWEERVSLHCTIKEKDAVAALEVRVVGEYHMELDNQVSQLLQGDK